MNGINNVYRIIVGITFVYFQPFATMYVNEDGWTHFNYSWIPFAFAAFAVGVSIASIIRFVGPKQAMVITLFGTRPIQVLGTGIKVTWPTPIGYTHRVVNTDVHDLPLKAQVKSADDVVYVLPANAQWFVEDPLLYAFERNNPDGQTENMLTSAMRTSANKRTLQETYGDKDEIQVDTLEATRDKLATFGVALRELVIQDPHLSDTTAKRLSAVREAELDKQAAAHEADAVFTRMVGHARAEAESTRLKGAALASFRLLIAEGNAAAIAVMQGKLAIKWIEETTGEGDTAVTLKKMMFVNPTENEKDGVQVPEIDISPEAILEFFKVVDGNDAIRDAAGKGATVVLGASAGVQGQTGVSAAILENLAALKSGIDQLASNTTPAKG